MRNKDRSAAFEVPPGSRVEDAREALANRRAPGPNDPGARPFGIATATGMRRSSSRRDGTSGQARGGMADCH